MRRFFILLFLAAIFAAGLWLMQPALPGREPVQRTSLAAIALQQLQLSLQRSESTAPEFVLADSAEADNSSVQLLAPRTAVLTRKVATPPLQDTENFLLLGLDIRPGEIGIGRPDTIVIVALSRRDNHVGLISVPRDLYVDIEGHGPDRINATYAVALRNQQKPAALLARVLTDTLALPINHTVEVNLGAFEDLVDALGGVEVDVPCPIYDNFIDPRTESGRRILDVPEGIVKMDGPTAGLYARSRHGRSDWNRARRQQAILFGLKDRLMSFQGLQRVPALLSTLQDNIKSDLSRAQLLSLFSQAMKVERSNVHGLVLGAKEAVPTKLENGKQVLVPEPEAISAALASLFEAAAPGTPPQYAACFARDAAVVGR